MKNIFKKVLITFILLIPFLGIKNVYAATARVKLTTNNTNVSLGSTFTVNVIVSEDGGKLGSWEYSIQHDSNYLSLVSGEEYQKAEVGDGSMTSKAYTLKYKAINNGSTTIKVTHADVRDWDTESKLDVQNGSLAINIGDISANNQSSSKSSDNSLKSLNISGVDLRPEFNKDTLEYNVTLSNDTNTIRIEAEANDSKSTVSGTGEVEVKEGQNTINIVVKAENSSTRTYIINAYVEEAEPVKVKIDEDNYVILKKLINIETPTGFEKTTIKINDVDIEAFYNKTIDYTLVALKDNIGNISFYIFDKENNTYTKYSPIVSNAINVIVLNPSGVEIPHRYKKSKFEYNNQEVTGYALTKNSKYRLIYGINTENGEKSFYLYDMEEHTLQRFYNDQVNVYEDLVNKCKLAFVILGGFIIFLTIVIIVLLSKNVKFKTTYIRNRLNPIDNPTFSKVKYQDLEGTRVMKKIDEKNLKKQKKKSKRKEKTFLNE